MALLVSINTHSRFLSPDGKCFAFDQRANGYGRGEGVATVVIKRLKDAIAAGDPIRAVIRESVLNQDGRSETITSPSQEAQEALMRDCYAKAGLEPDSTQYFEAHGTGTATGDPIEVGAIASVFQSGKRRKESSLRIGSVKTNIGHTEATSGLASVIKVALAMEKGILPPSINFEIPNPHLFLEERRLKVVTELEKWPAAPGQKMRASVNNFGYGGSNAHIIMEDANAHSHNISAHGKTNGTVNGHTNGVGPDTPGSTVDKYSLLIVSAKDEHAHENMVARLRYFLRQADEDDTRDTEALLQSLVYTLGQRRTIFPWVAAYPVPMNQGLDGLAKVLATPKFRPSRLAQRKRIGMVFTGQGAQWHAMGRELIETYPVFKDSLLEADRYLRELGADWSLMEELGRDADASRVNQTAFSIPICAAVQIALARLLDTWGVIPSAVTSHSSGEIAAAFTVGAISLRLAMGIAFYRSRLAAEMTASGPIRGGMLAVGLGHVDMEPYLERLTCGARVVVACVNSPFSTTMAGDIEAIEELETLLKADDVFARRLRVDTAYHSHHMNPVAEKYRQALRDMPKEEPKTKRLTSVAFASPVTGYRMTSTKAIASPDHWVGSLMRPVQFVDAFTEMVHGDLSAEPGSHSVDIIVEVGPHTALGGPIQEILTLDDFEGIKLPYYGSLVRHNHAVESLQALASNLLKEGYPLDVEAVNFPNGRSENVRVLTDLPSYPWNHQTRHWFEPRFNLGLRKRDIPPHPFLGSLVPGINPEAPVWRHIIRATDSPWVQDHAIQSKMLYPGCGFICLAIEAITQQLAIAEEQEDREITGYRVRDMNVQQALVIPDTAEGIEIRTSLRASSDRVFRSQDWREFEIHSVTSENRWMRHAKGLVKVEFEDIQKDVSSPSQEIRRARVIDATDMWSTLEPLGIKYGPSFRNISNIRQSRTELRSTSTITVPETSVPNDLPPTHVVHPATLDAVAQAAFTALPGAAFHQQSPRVFQGIESLWISRKTNSEAGHSFQCHTRLDYADAQGIGASVALVDQDRPVVEVHGLKLRSMGGNGTQSSQGGLCARVAWDHDVGLDLHSDVVRLADRNEDLRRLSLYLIEDALAAISPPEVDKLEGHYREYYAWMKEQLQSVTADEGTRSDREIIFRRVAEASPRGEMLCRVGPALATILRGQKAPRDLMNERDVLEKWSSKNSSYGVTQGAVILRQIAHKWPRARILEVDARPDGITRTMLEALGPLGSLYHFTGASGDGFKQAEEDLAAWSDILMLDTLDIAKEPSSQGFEPSSYDVVIASGAVKLTSQILKHVQSLIKPGGKLLMVETHYYELDRLLMLGLLPEWWDSRRSDQKSPECLEIGSLNQLLKDAGFSGIDVALSDHEGQTALQTNTILSTLPATQSARPPCPGDIVLITSEETGAPPSQWIEALQSFLSALESATTPGSLPSICVLESSPATSYAGKICVFLGEIEQPVLRSVGETSFEAIKAMTTTCKGLVWVTRGGSVDCERPDLGLAAGFLRTARSEYLGRSYVTLDLDPFSPPWSEEDVCAIVQVLKKMSLDSVSPVELEYAVRDGVFKIPRVLEDAPRNRSISPSAAAADTKAIEPGQLSRTDRALRLHVGVPGRLDTLSFVEDASLSNTDELSPETVEIEPQAYGINAQDVMVATGKLRGEFMGLEGAGIITRVGAEAAAQGFTPGDKIFGLMPRSGLGSIARTPWTNIHHMPEALSFEEAASLPVAYCTAYFCLTRLASLQRDQTVLIHSAAEGVGQAAIMVARHIGAEVFATAVAPEDRALLAQRYGIPEDHLFDSRDASFSAGLKVASNGRGVDVVLGSLSGPLLQESFSTLAPFGHLVQITQLDLETSSHPGMPLSKHPASFSAFSLLALAHHDPQQLHRTMVGIAQLVGKQKLSPVYPLTSYSIEDISEAFRHLQKDSHVGKAVFSVGLDAKVPVLKQSLTPRFMPDASYLLVGGVGGIGSSIARWMADQGAKNIIVLSRSAGWSAQAGALVEELSQQGCRVKAVSCDVSSESGLADSLRQCQEDGLPPVRGVIQGAMVLKVSYRNVWETNTSFVLGADSQLPRILSLSA